MANIVHLQETVFSLKDSPVVHFCRLGSDRLYVVERINNSLYKIKSLKIFKKYTSSFFFFCYCKRRQFRNIQSNKDAQLFPLLRMFQKQKAYLWLAE